MEIAAGSSVAASSLTASSVADSGATGFAVVAPSGPVGVASAASAGASRSEPSSSWIAWMPSRSIGASERDSPESGSTGALSWPSASIMVALSEESPMSVSRACVCVAASCRISELYGAR